MDERKDSSTPTLSPADGTDQRRKGKRKHPCQGCFYYGGMSAAVKCCNYFLITGRRRPCEPGEGCTVKKERGGTRRKAMRIKNYPGK